jgi:hypothetical protein
VVGALDCTEVPRDPDSVVDAEATARIERRLTASPPDD